MGFGFVSLCHQVQCIDVYVMHHYRKFCTLVYIYIYMCIKTITTPDVDMAVVQNGQTGQGSRAYTKDFTIIHIARTTCLVDRDTLHITWCGLIWWVGMLKEITVYVSSVTVHSLPSHAEFSNHIIL